MSVLGALQPALSLRECLRLLRNVKHDTNGRSLMWRRYRHAPDRSG